MRHPAAKASRIENARPRCQALAAHSVIGGVMMIARFRTLLTAIFRPSSRPILAFVGAVPRPVETRRGRSAGFDAVTRLRNGQYGGQAKGRTDGDRGKGLEHGVVSLPQASSRPKERPI